MALICAAVLVAVGSEDAGKRGKGGTRSEDLGKIQDEILARTVVDPRAGISVRRPESWPGRAAKGVVSLRSSDSCVSVTLAASSATTAAQLLRESVTVFRRSYRAVRARPGGATAIGGLPTLSRTITFDAGRGQPLRAVVAVSRGKVNAYLTEVVIRDPSCAGAIQRAQVVLSSVEFTR